MNAFYNTCEVSRFLLQINAIKLNVENPFTWASGLRAPIYCDNRRILSFPEIRDYMARLMVEKVQQNYTEANLIAGVATGAIAMGVLVADKLRLPFVYVRSGSKTHGLGARIEGHVAKGQNAVVVEDLVSTAQSSLAAVEVLREAGIHVNGMISIFTYGLRQAEENLREAGCTLHSLSNYDKLLQTIQYEKRFSDREMKALTEWRIDPLRWSDERQKKN